MKNTILFSIIAVAFVGGMFTVAYAGPVLTTITLAGTVDMVNNQIKNLQDPTDPQDAATKSFVESLFTCEGGAEMCSVGLGECQRDGINICTSGVAQCSAVPGPASSETCDGLDNDCDGIVDDELATSTFYEDADFDGHGNFESSIESCSQPTGFVTDSSDCDDTNAFVSPSAEEILDGIDNNCDGQIDEGLNTVTLVINEILFDGSVDGDPNCDGVLSAINDEFIEIVNIGISSVDLTGFTLSDDDGVLPRHTFSSGTILNSGSAIVVYGGGNPSCLFSSNVISDVTSTGSLGLTDSGDTITLRDLSGTIIDAHTWTGSQGVDESIVRAPEFDFGAPFVDHSTISGLDFSPGTDAFGNIILIP